MEESFYYSGRRGSSACYSAFAQRGGRGAAPSRALASRALASRALASRALASRGRRTTAKWALTALFALAFMALPASEASARGGFRGGGFRAPSIRIAPRLSAPRAVVPRLAPKASTGWGSATKPSAAGTSGAASGIAPGAAAGASGTGSSRILGSSSRQRTLYDSARRNGTLFSSRTEAESAFRATNASRYSTRFASEPASRPSYVPQATSVGGNSVNIVYNAGLGGYGYMHPVLGTWILYDALADAAMADALMSGQGYYWGGAPSYFGIGNDFLGIAFALLVLFLVAALAVRIVAARANGRRKDW